MRVRPSRIPPKKGLKLLPIDPSPPTSCRCHSGYVGTRCEHADLLAVVAANQKTQTITALLVVAVVASAVLIAACVLGQ